MKKIITLLVVLLPVCATYAQLDINAFNATGAGYATTRLTDYQCLGVNPANLGWTWNNNAVNFGLAEMGISIHTDALTRKQVMKDMFDNSIKLDMDQKLDAAANFTDSRVWAQGGMTWLGVSYQDDKIGGLAFSIRDRGMWHTKFNSAAARFLFLGYHDSYFDSLAVEGTDTIGYATNPQSANIVYNGTRFEFIWYREYNLAYGRQIIKNDVIELYGGLGLKYLVGYGSLLYYQVESDLNAYSALCPVFDVDYGTPTPSQIEGKGLKKVGSGFGIDLGATFVFKKNLKASIAINDIGSINWDGNVYEGQEVRVWKIETSGIDNYNIFEQGDLIITDNAPNDNGEWEGLENKRVSLATHMRMGASYKVHPKVEFGGDLLVPLKKDLPGSYMGPVFALGTVYEPVRWVQLSLGLVSGKELGTNVPIGVTFFPARDEDTSWTFGFALRDISTYLKESEPTVSAAFGFLRFSFGKK
ncbi:MAG: DUF5723 family protein [Bacteroidales bacterium]